MTVAKVIELIGSSPKSWEDAANQAIKRAAKTVRNIKGIDVVHQKAKVSGGKIKEYRVVLHLAFEVED